MTKFVKFKDVIEAVIQELAKMQLGDLRDWSSKASGGDAADLVEVTEMLDASEECAKELREARNYPELIAVLDAFGFKPEEAAEFIFDCVVEKEVKQDVDDHEEH